MINPSIIETIRSSGGAVVHCRRSWLRARMVEHNVLAGAARLEPGSLVAKIGCPHNCIEVWVVADDAIESDWEVVQ